MKVPDAADGLAATPDASRVFGEPYQTADGTTVIPVAKVRRRARPGADDSAVRAAVKPLGVFVIKDGTATWQPAVDVTRIALMGELIGLVAAALVTLAIARRPPWPDLRCDASLRT